MDRLEVKQFAPAKINLYLHILGCRPDGFHELETLMAPISLGDTLDLDLIPAGTVGDGTLSSPAPIRRCPMRRTISPRKRRDFSSRNSS